MKKTRIALFLIILLSLLYVLFITIAPGVIENQHNTVISAPPYQVDANASKVHLSLDFIADLHSDALLWKRDLLKKSDRGHVDIPRLQEANAALQVFTIVSKTPKNQNYSNNTDETDNITLLQFAQGNPPSTWNSLYARAIYQAGRLQQMADDSENNFVIIRQQKELENFIEQRKVNPRLTAGMLGVEGAHMLEGDIENLSSAYEAGIRILAPVHFFDNALGGSAHGTDKGGLTEFGRTVIRKAEEFHMIIDLSHGSTQLIDDILNMTTQPVIVTHTGVRGTCDNNRNLSDEQLRRIADTGGLVGIALFEQAVCGNDAQATVRAIRHATDVMGIKHVALGSDFDGAVTTHFDVTGLVKITEALITAGYSSQEISQIMGGNARDFFLKNLPRE